MAIIKLPEHTLHKPDLLVASKNYGWHFENLQIEKSWKDNRGKNVKIAVLDSGFTPHESILNVKESISFVKEEDEKDYSNHGTGVIGILGGNCKFMCGICPDAEIYSLKILNRYGMGGIKQLSEALDWCLSRDIDIVNLSISSPKELGVNIVWKLKALQMKGVIVVVASGNSYAKVEYPAKYETTLAIGAYGRNGKIARFSNKGEEIDFAAPGVNIFTCDNKNEYVFATGTSFAAPIFTGTMALLLHKYDFNSLYDLKDFLTEEIRDMGKVGKDNAFGWGSVVPVRYLDNEQPPKVNSLFMEGEEGEEEGERERGIYDMTFENEIEQQKEGRIRKFFRVILETLQDLFQ